MTDGHAGNGPTGDLKEVTESGLVAGRDARLSGTWVSGRDINVQIVRPSPGIRTGVFQLPPDIDDFTDRDVAVREVRTLLERDQESQGTAVVVSAIAGKAGVGKTALATRIAHLLRAQYPDGQLYVNLRGQEAQRLDAGDVLGEFLLELGVPRAAIPERLDQRAARYRAQLDGHRMLIVLDNAAEEAQVRPLLLGSPGCAALITSRAALTGLAGTRSFMLDVLERDEAVELLAKVAGQERVAAEPEAAERIIQLCGCLPLAVRIAGAKLAARPHWTLEMLASRLANEHNLLAELKVRDLEVRASFDLSYRDLSEDERRTFRLLGLLRGPDFTAWAAAALLNSELAEAEDLVERLVEAQVLEVARQADTGEVRYRFHDLLRAFARNCLWTEEPPAAQEAALQRALDAHLALAHYAGDLLEPGGTGVVSAGAWVTTRAASVAQRIAADPAAWFAAERINLINAVEQAEENDLSEVTWELARSLNYFLKLRTHWRDWQHTQELALRAARRAGNRSAEANALRSLGDVGLQRGRFDEAIAHFEQAIELFRTLDDRTGEGWTLLGLGDVLLDRGRFDEARAHFEQALARFGLLQNRRGQAWTLASFGVIDRVQGRIDEAKAHVEQALELFRRLGDLRGEAFSLINLGIVHRERGQFEAALSWFERARPIFQRLGDHHGETYALLNIGHMHRERGRHDEALAALNACRAAFLDTGDRLGEAWALAYLAMIDQERGRYDQATASFHRCMTLFHSVGDRRGEGFTLLGLGDVYREQGRLEDALACFDRALRIHREVGYRLAEAKVLSSYGLALAANGDRESAAAMWHEALEIFRQLGASEASKVEGWLREQGRSNCAG